MTKTKRTYLAGAKRVMANARQLKAKKGKYYERWKKGMREWASRDL